MTKIRKHWMVLILIAFIMIIFDALLFYGRIELSLETVMLIIPIPVIITFALFLVALKELAEKKRRKVK